MARINLTRDGLNLVGEREEPFGEVYNMALIMHGITADKNRPLLREIADHLRDENVASVRFDFNGHGESDGAFKDMTVPSAISDARTFLDYVRTDPHVRDIYLIGHSMGGVVASMLAGMYPDIVKKLVLLAPAAVLRDDAINGQVQGNEFNPHRIPDMLLLHGQELGGFYLRSARHLPIYETAADFTGPVNIIQGTNDQVVPQKYAEKYEQIYANSKLHLIKNADHRFSDAYQDQAVKLTSDFLKPSFY